MEPVPTTSRRPTVRDVADRAGVGVATVSRVLNGRSNVAADTARRVRAAIESLEFTPDETARTLHPNRASTLVVLLLGNLTNSFYAGIAYGALTVAQQADHAVVLGTVDEDPGAERRLLDTLIARRVAGLVVVPDQRDYSYLRAGLSRRLPVVFADRPGAGIAADTVLADNQAGGALATGRLIEAGHRRIAVLLPRAHYTPGMRLRGYRQAHRAAGLAVPEDLVRRLERGTVEHAERATGDLLGRPDPPTAVFAATGFLAEGAARAIRRAGARTDLVGFDDPRLTSLLPQGVPIVAADPTEIGAVAMTLLLGRIRGDSSKARRLTVPVTVTEPVLAPEEVSWSPRPSPDAD